MMKPISPTMHGVLDYATTAATAAAPRIFDFPDKATKLAYGLAGSYGSLSAVTNYPLSVKRVVPFKAHGMIEAAVGLALPVMPFAMGFAKNKAARNFFLGLTALTFVTAALTDWSAKD